MSERPFHVLVDLVHFDQRIHAIEKQIETLDQEIIDLNSQEKTVKNNVVAAKDQVHVLLKEVDTQELEMKVLDQQEREKKHLLETITNYKEYESVKTEIESIQQSQLQQEQIVLDVWNRLESAQRESEKAEKESHEMFEKIHHEIEENQQKIETLRAELASLTEQRPEKEKLVPEEWREKYSLMRARVSDPVVPILQNSCSACFSIVTDQDVICSKRGALIQCKGCYRLLYMPDDVVDVKK